MSVKDRLAGLIVTALAICGPGTHQHCWSQDTNYLDMLNSLYAFDTWAGKTKTDYGCRITNWVPDFASMGLTNFVLRDEGVWTNSQKHSRYIFHPADAPEGWLHLDIFEATDVTNVHLAMVSYFTTFAAPQPLPLGSSLGVDIGDRCYLNWGVLSSVCFVRNNVFVFITGGYSVLSFAERLDSQLVARSFTGPVLLQPGITGYTFHVRVPTAPGKSYVLEYKDSLVGTNWGASPSFTGDGTIRLVAVPVWPPQRFFRLRVE